MKIGRIPYINCYPVYGAIDRGVVHLDAQLVDGVPTDLNRRMATAVSFPPSNTPAIQRDIYCCPTSRYPATDRCAR